MEKGKKHTLIHSFTLLTISLIALSACGPLNGGREPASVGYSTTESLTAQRELTAEERTIATRICYAYQSKSNNFRTAPYLGGIFSFDVKLKDCSDKISKYEIPSILIDNGDNSLSYKPSNQQDFYTKVQTNRHGYLTQLCAKIQTNQVVTNTTETLQSTVQISFAKNGLDSFTIKYFAPNTLGKLLVKSAETFSVRTQFNLTAGKILGMDEGYAFYSTCPDSVNYSELTQNFLNFKAN